MEKNISEDSEIKKFIDGIPMVGEGVSKAEHHRILKEYLDEKLPRDTFDAVNVISELVSRSRINPDIWLTRTAETILKKNDHNLKITELFYFLENLYSLYTKYSSQKVSEESFTEALQCFLEFSTEDPSLQDPAVEEFLMGVYPDYVDELDLEF